ncbi:MAG: guanylate kinase [Oscillospiraceae bacterium]|nr:guanylate kinase [Oscillospiraceae bacterium]
MNEKGKLIVISGPSGSGKSTVVNKAIQGRKDMCFSTSVTTRSPRPGEVDGKDYFFIDPQRFQEMVERDELLEHAQYVSHSYGTPRAFVEQKLNDALNVILDIEVQGARQVREKMKDAVLIFIVPPSLEELRRRLVNRGTDAADVIEARLQRASEELKEADLYDYLIINDDLETAAREFTSILTAEHCRVPHRIHLLKDF